jgi:hypothetical protein
VVGPEALRKGEGERFREEGSEGMRSAALGGVVAVGFFCEKDNLSKRSWTAWFPVGGLEKVSSWGILEGAVTERWATGKATGGDEWEFLVSPSSSMGKTAFIELYEFCLV